MSTGWDLHCPTHLTGTDLDWNHGDEALALLWRNRGQLVALDTEMFDISEVHFSGAGKFAPLYLGAIGWLKAHADCPVQLVNEYGDRKDVATMAKLPPKHCPTCSCEPR